MPRKGDVTKLNDEASENEVAITREVARIHSAIKNADKHNGGALCLLLVTKKYKDYLFECLSKVPLNCKDAVIIRDIVYKDKFYSNEIDLIFKVMFIDDLEDTVLNYYVKNMAVLMIPGQKKYDDDFILNAAYLSRGNDFLELYFDTGEDSRYFHSCEQYFYDCNINIFDCDFIHMKYEYGFQTCHKCGCLRMFSSWNRDKWLGIKREYNKLYQKVI